MSGAAVRSGRYAHRAWVDQQVFDEPALAETLALYRGALEAREAELAAADRPSCRRGRTRDPLAGPVARLGGYRGIAQLTGLTLAAEVVDWRRFASARAFMGFTGLIPQRVLQRVPHPPRPHHQGRPGRRCAPPWSRRRGPTGPGPAIGADLRRRQDGLPPATLARSWKAQQRLHATYAKMTARGKPPGVVVTAVARELAGFVWAEMTS